MFSRTPELYDVIDSSLKDYTAEATQLAGILHDVAPSAHDLLDVACGTGEHARLLRTEHGYAVDGLDIELRFVELAAAKLPGAHVWQGDMTSFEVPGRYDAILCLFSSIGYVLRLLEP